MTVSSFKSNFKLERPTRILLTGDVSIVATGIEYDTATVPHGFDNKPLLYGLASLDTIHYSPIPIIYNYSNDVITSGPYGYMYSDNNNLYFVIHSGAVGDTLYFKFIALDTSFT